MKSITKNVFLAGALFASTLAVHAQGQYTPNAYVRPFTNALGATSYTGYPATSNQTTLTIGPVRQKSITVQLDMFNDSASATIHQFVYRTGTDGVTYGPTATAGFSQSAYTGTGLTNIPLLGCGYFQILYVTNATVTGNCTNGAIRIPLNYNSP